MSCKKFCASGRDNLLSRLQATRRAATPTRARPAIMNASCMLCCANHA